MAKSGAGPWADSPDLSFKAFLSKRPAEGERTPKTCLWTDHLEVVDTERNLAEGYRHAMAEAEAGRRPAVSLQILELLQRYESTFLKWRTAHRLIAKLPTIAAATYKHSIGEPFMQPRNDLSFVGNLLYMMYARPQEPYEVDQVAEKALDVLFILHADHEQNA